MTDATPRLEVGRVAKAHGLRGEVVVATHTSRAERFAPGASLYAGSRPLVVGTARRHGDRWLVRFEGIDDRTEAELLRGVVLTGDPIGPAGAGEMWVHELVGAEVVERTGSVLGRVAAVEANPAHDLLVLESGVLIPMPFVVAHDPGRIVVELPDGLLELFES